MQDLEGVTTLHLLGYYLESESHFCRLTLHHPKGHSSAYGQDGCQQPTCTSAFAAIPAKADGPFEAEKSWETLVSLEIHAHPQQVRNEFTPRMMSSTSRRQSRAAGQTINCGYLLQTFVLLSSFCR